jgi:hypothetical protein
MAEPQVEKQRHPVHAMVTAVASGVDGRLERHAYPHGGARYVVGPSPGTAVRALPQRFHARRQAAHARAHAAHGVAVKAHGPVEQRLQLERIAMKVLH